MSSQQHQRTVSTSSQSSFPLLQKQLKAEKRHLFRVALGKGVATALLSVCFFLQIAKTPYNPNGDASIGTAGPFWAICQHTSAEDDAENFGPKNGPSYYVGCITTGVMFSFLGAVVSGVGAAVFAMYIVSSSIRLIKLSKLGSQHSLDHALACFMLGLVHVWVFSVSVLSIVHKPFGSMIHPFLTLFLLFCPFV